MAEPSTVEIVSDKTVEFEARREKIDRMLEISHQIDQADRDRIPQSELQEKDVKEIIAKYGPITVKDWMYCVLYGKDGYYSSGRAKINTGDFVTAVSYLPDVSAFTKDILSNLQTKNDQPVVVSVASGGGEFDRNFQTVIKTDFPDQHPKLVSLDYSLQLLKQQKEKVENEDDQAQRTTASATEIPLKTGSVDAVFSNELHDAFPCRGFRIDNGDISELMIGLDENNHFKPIYHALSSSPEDMLKRELVDLRLEQIKSTQDDLSYGFITWNPGTLEFLKESTRVLKKGGVSIHADYVQRSGARYNGPGYNDDFRFQLEGNWQNFIRDDVEKYHPPYLDVTVSMDPNLIKWAAPALGLEVISDEPHDDFVKFRAASIADRRNFGRGYHVVTLRKK